MAMKDSVSQVRGRAIELACKVRDHKPVYIDTETTGLGMADEIVEISIIDHDGCVLLESLVKPSKPIPQATTRIHGITNEDVRTAPPWPTVWNDVRSLLAIRLIVIYNADFDIRMMKQSHMRYNMPWKDTFSTLDLLKLYAEYRGEWDIHRRAYRFHSLAEAGRHSGISIPNAHRATADALLTRALLLHIANSAQ
jgi:DNA polymerase III subunit epsilon